MTMRSILKSWVERYFSDEEALILLLVLVGGFAAIIWFGRMLAPFFHRSGVGVSAARRGQRPDEAASAALAGRHFGVCGVR